MIEVANTAIRDKLIANATIATACSTRVYFGFAPLGAVMPYAIFAVQAGGMDNDTALESVDLRYLVKVVSEDGESALDLQEAIKSALHEATLTGADGWTVTRCQLTEAVFYQENDDKRTYWHAGGQYRVRMSK